ncbi:GRAM domain-containing protein 2A-like isoform X2 [Pogoniulus pusillus]|uniref:GRAM domain-containing protein 2A-like isoform X2 n=1 Tax=Pogoniulus pusillus TaxID=488313 RepID=UPI0030B92046
MPGKLRRSRKRVLEKQWQSLEEKGTVGAQLGHSLLTRSKTCDPSFGKETEQAVATTGAQGYASPCPSPSLTKHTASYHKAFGELAKQEALLACFSCAWQREMPYRGRLYISSHHICFHSSLLLKDIKVVVPVASISALKKTNMALLVPNALSIRTAEGEKQFLFVSLRQREATYQLLKSVCRQLQDNSRSPLTSLNNEEVLRKPLTSSHSDLEQSVPEPDSLQELPDGMTLVPGQAEQKDGGEAEALSGSSAAPVPFARPCSLQGGPHTTLWAWTAMQLSPLNVIILIYLLLMVALLLSSGYIGLRISELEQQLASMGAWPDLNLPHQDKRT